MLISFGLCTANFCCDFVDFSLLWNDGDAAVDIDDNYIIRLSITLAQRTLN